MINIILFVFITDKCTTTALPLLLIRVIFIDANDFRKLTSPILADLIARLKFISYLQFYWNVSSIFITRNRYSVDYYKRRHFYDLKNNNTMILCFNDRDQDCCLYSDIISVLILQTSLTRFKSIKT